MVSEELTEELLKSADCVVIATDHSCYDWKWIVDKAIMVFDCRNATKGIVSEKIYRLGEKRD
jgi:UDP-N-acetyl-D-glucosamine dehydrogenase